MIYLTVLSLREFNKILREQFIIRYAFHRSPFGKCLLALHGKKICHLSFVHDDESRNLEALRQQWPGAEIYPDKNQTTPVFERIFSGDDGSYELLLRGTPFQTKVWNELLRIPEGCTVSLQELAENVGRQKAVRAVANAVKKNFVAYLIPCHRVTGKTGGFEKYRWGSEIKKKILDFEEVHGLIQRKI